MAEFYGTNKTADAVGDDSPFAEQDPRFLGTFNDRGYRYRRTAQDEYGAVQEREPGSNRLNPDAVNPSGYAQAGDDFDPYGFQNRVFKEETYRTGGATSTVDPNAFFLGGEEDWANDYYDEMRGYSAAYGARGGPQADLGGYDDQMMGFAGGQMYGGAQLDAYGQDLGYLRDVARGTAGPSPAEIAMERQADEAMRQQLAMARSGRGSGAATLQAQALQNNAMQQGALVRDTGELRAQEQLNAMGLMAQANQGYSGAIQDFTGAYTDAGALAADTAYRGVEADLEARAQNDQMVQFFMDQGMDAQKAQAAAMQAYEGLRTGNVLTEREMAFRNQAPEGFDWESNALGAVIDTGANWADAGFEALLE